MDRSSIEVFADEGQVTLSEVTLENPNQDVTLVAGGGGMRVVSLEANRLESIWTRTDAPAQMIHGRAGNTGRNVLIGHGFSYSRNAMVDIVTYLAIFIDSLAAVDIFKIPMKTVPESAWPDGACTGRRLGWASCR